MAKDKETTMETEEDPVGHTLADIPSAMLTENGNINQSGDVEVKQTASGINRLHLSKKLSGAQRRKLATEAAKAAGEAIRPRKQRANREWSRKTGDMTQRDIKEPTGSRDSKPSHLQISGTKRYRSESSTPSA